MLRCSYQNCLFEKETRKQALSRAIEKLEDIDFDTIVVTGVSGTFGAILAHLMDKHLVVVRKNVNDCHSRFPVENLIPNHLHRVVIVDDCISTGETLHRIMDKLAKECGSSRTNMEFLGVYVYGNYSYSGKFLASQRNEEWACVEDLNKLFQKKREKYTPKPCNPFPYDVTDVVLIA